ncbi:hypothetical protein CRE_02704 [Caenorhabditis remanei]|uniref:Uncharacterized protein n=1 Tax=Caenorhabditis remanei TaxID=31234 RepID=E3NMA3_CAERE|nr:hypothetical protein CRE_02704 [Caenorhabditis remanei]
MNRQPGITDENSIHVILQGTCNPVQNGPGIPRHGTASRQYDRETPRLRKSTECILLETCEGTTIPRLEPRRTQEKGKIMVSRYLGIHCFNDTELIRKPSGHLVESSVFMVLQWVNNSLKTSDEGKKFSKVKVQVCSETLNVADPKKIPDVGVCRSGTPTEGIGRKSNGTEPKLVPLFPTLDACRSGAPKERMVPPAPDSDSSEERSWREVPSLEACRSGAPKGRIVPPAPDSDSSEEGSWREVPTLDACRSGASKIRIGLKSSGLEQLPDSGSPRNANSLAFDGTPRSGTAPPAESATDMDACRSGAPRKRRLQSPEYVLIPESVPPRIANSLAFDGKPRSGTTVSSDTGSVMDVGRSGTSKGRIVPPAPDSDACRSGASGKGSWWEVPNLEASRSGASKAKVPPRAPDSDTCRSDASGKGPMRRVPNLDAKRHASSNDSAKMYSNPKAPRQRTSAKMDDWTESSGSAISHDDDGPTDIVNQCPGVSYPMVSPRPDPVDHAKARSLSHRVRSFNPRKSKANLACYACITQEAGTQTPRSVDSPLVPESGPCPTPN